MKSWIPDCSRNFAYLTWKQVEALSRIREHAAGTAHGRY